MKRANSEKIAYSWIFKRAKKYKWFIALLSLLSIISSVLVVIQAWCYREVIDSIKLVEDLKNYSPVLGAGMLFVAVILLQNLINVSLRYAESLLEVKFLNNIRKKLIKKIYRKDYAGITGYHSGDILNRMFNDARIVSSNIITLIPSVTGLSVKLLGSIAFIYTLNSSFCGFIVICGALICIGLTLLRKKLKQMHKDIQSAAGKVRSVYQEQVLGLLMIKVFGAEAKMLSVVDNVQEGYKGKVLKQRVFTSVVNFFYSIAYNFMLISALLFSVYGIINGTSTYGSLTAIIQLVSTVQASVSELSGIFPKIYSTIASTERICEIEALPDEPEEKEEICDVSEIELEEITFSYGRTDVLNNVNLSVKKGETVAISGISGTGKSTILLLMLGIYNPSSGKIWVKDSFGKSVYAGKSTRNLFSYIPQGSQLFSGTILDNLLLGNPKASEEEIDKALKISCSDSFINDFPQGINTIIGENGAGLSEGQQQRIAIARAILSNSPVILLDEATSALDEETEIKFINNLKTIDKTCILITHRKSPLSICNKAYNLDTNGNISLWKGQE